MTDPPVATEAQAPADGGPPPGGSDATSRALVDRAPRVAWWTFVALVVAAGPLYAAAGRDQWFFQDEWVFLATRDGGSVDGLLAPHNDHWTTLPVIAYRLLWNVVGLHHYEPYQALSIGLHLVIVVLIRAVMRRMGVGPWLATAAAAAVLLYGNGSENVLWAFQITFLGSMALGLGHLLVADHPAPSARRVVAALACGLGALMCSGLGLVMVGVVGLAMLLRRGWRTAALVTAPLVPVYLAWWVVYRDDIPRHPRATPTEVLAFTGRGLGRALETATPHQGVAVALLLVALLGLALTTWAARGSLTEVGRRTGTAVALAAGGVGFFLLSGSARAVTFGPEFATRGRYSYVAVALLAPPIALGLDAVARRWPVTTIPLLVLVLAGTPANVRAIDGRSNRVVTPEAVLALAASPALDDAPRDQVLYPDVTGARALTPGWLADGVAEGRIPRVGVGADARAEALALLALTEGTAPDPGDECAPLGGEQTVTLEQDRPVRYSGVIEVQVTAPGGGLSDPRPFGALGTRSLSTRGPDLTVRITPDPGPYPEVLCRA